MEDAARHRFVIDENETVVDNLTYFVYQSLQTQKGIDDDRFPFLMNRVFREYLLPGSPSETEYKPLSITWLLRQSDAKAAHYIKERWAVRYGIEMRCAQLPNETYSCSLSKTIGESTYTITTNEESDTETLASLLALAAACFEWSTIQRTEQYLIAKTTEQ